VPAPVTQGAEVAKLVVSAPDTETIELPLFAGAEVGRLSGFGRIGAAISYLVWGGGE
jgi:D-alanyl-D-alanine carboxypeptidase (penicillin-binding protein 5/6)